MCLFAQLSHWYYSQSLLFSNCLDKRSLETNFGEFTKDLSLRVFKKLLIVISWFIRVLYLLFLLQGLCESHHWWNTSFYFSSTRSVLLKMCYLFFSAVKRLVLLPGEKAGVLQRFDCWIRVEGDAGFRTLLSVEAAQPWSDFEPVFLSVSFIFLTGLL